jgi:LPXTG-motif cell wall-anchored protein
VKRTPLALGLTTGLAIAAASLLTALPASALTVSPGYASFLSTDNEFSAVSPDGSVIAYSAYSDYIVTLLDTATGSTTVVTDANSDLNEPGGLVFSPDGATLYVANYGVGDIAVIDVASAALTETLDTGDLYAPWTIAIAPDGTKLYIGDYSNNTMVTYDLGTDTTATVPSVGEPYAIYVSADGTTVYNMDYYGDVDVLATGTGLITNTFSNVSGEFYGSCTNSDVSVLYMVDYAAQTLYSVSLADGAILAMNDTDLPNDSNFSCAVSPDDATVFVTNDSAGTTGGEYTEITSPGIVSEFTASDLTLVAVHELAGVAYTQVINFYDACNAYVAGYYGNAQSISIDGCVVGGEEAQSGAGSEAALANTGTNAGGMAALVAGFALAGAATLVARRRLARN